MKLHLTLWAAAALCLATVTEPANAEGDTGCKGGCGQETPDPKPEPPAKPRQPADKGNPYDTPEPQHWTGVCEYLPDGRILVHTAFLRDPQTAAIQCRQRLEAISD